MILELLQFKLLIIVLKIELIRIKKKKEQLKHNK